MFIEGKCSYSDGGEITVLEYAGQGILAYAFNYPGGGDLYWTQIHIKDSSADVFGIHYGDNANDLSMVMERYGYVNMREIRASSDNTHGISEYRKGDLHLTFTFYGDYVTDIFITVYEDQQDSGRKY